MLAIPMKPDAGYSMNECEAYIWLLWILVFLVGRHERWIDGVFLWWTCSEGLVQHNRYSKMPYPSPLNCWEQSYDANWQYRETVTYLVMSVMGNTFLCKFVMRIRSSPKFPRNLSLRHRRGRDYPSNCSSQNYAGSALSDEHSQKLLRDVGSSIKTDLIDWSYCGVCCHQNFEHWSKKRLSNKSSHVWFTQKGRSLGCSEVYQTARKYLSTKCLNASIKRKGDQRDWRRSEASKWWQQW